LQVKSRRRFPPEFSPKKAENVVNANIFRNLAASFKFYPVSLIFAISLFFFRRAVRPLAVGAFVLVLNLYKASRSPKTTKNPQFLPKIPNVAPPFLSVVVSRTPRLRAPSNRLRAADRSPRSPPDLPDAKKALK
jgi:hypothetical protein